MSGPPDVADDLLAPVGSLGGSVPTERWSPRTGLILHLHWGAVVVRRSHVVLAARATRVPQAAGMSDNQRQSRLLREGR